MSFQMTISSDEEGPSPSGPSASSSKSGPNKGGKLTRKEQLAARKGSLAKGGKATKQKRKRMDDVSDEEDDKTGANKAGSDEEGMMEDFVFDGLGGGFVGEKKGSVWVCSIVQKRLLAVV